MSRPATAWSVVVLLLALASAGCLAGDAPAASTSDAAPAAPSGIAPGDVVTFDLAIHDADGRLLFSTRHDDAAAAGLVEAGLAPRDPEDPIYRPMRFGLQLPALDSTRVSLVPFLLGRQAGDVVTTPLLVDPLTPPEPAEIPAEIGPFRRARTAAADEFRAILSDPAAQVAPGAELLVEGNLSARVESVDEGVVRYRVTTPAGSRVDLAAVPVPITLREDADDPESFFLRLAPEPGHLFRVVRCQFTSGLEPGYYALDGEEGGRLHLTRHPVLPAPAAAGRDVRFVLTILEHAPPASAPASPAPAVNDNHEESP